MKENKSCVTKVWTILGPWTPSTLPAENNIYKTEVTLFLSKMLPNFYNTLKTENFGVCSNTFLNKTKVIESDDGGFELGHWQMETCVDLWIQIRYPFL